MKIRGTTGRNRNNRKEQEQQEGTGRKPSDLPLLTQKKQQNLEEQQDLEDTTELGGYNRTKDFSKLKPFPCIRTKTTSLQKPLH